MADQIKKGFIANALRKMGKGKEADEIEEKLQGLGDALNKANIIQKNVRTGRVQKAMLDGLYADMEKVLNRHLGEVNEALRDELVATVLSSAMATSTEPTDTEEISEEEMAGLDEVMTEEMMEDDEEIMVEENAKKPMSKEYVAMRKEFGAVAKAVNEQNDMVAGIIGELVNMAEAITALTPLIQKADEITTLQNTVKAMQSKLNSAPRSAVNSPNAEITSPAVLEILKSQTTQYVKDPVLGIPLREEKK